MSYILVLYVQETVHCDDIKENAMRKVLIVLLAAAMLLLCGCSDQSGGAKADTEKEPFYYWVNMKSRYPLGMNAEITGLAASGDAVFVCGNADEELLFSRIPYKIEEGLLSCGDAEKIELPDYPAGSYMINLTFSSGKVYVLLGVWDEQKDGIQYIVHVYLPDGSLLESMDLPYSGDEPAEHILVQDNGTILLRGMHDIRIYSGKGELLTSVDVRQMKLLLPRLLGEEIYVPYEEPNPRRASLGKLDPGTGELSKIESMDNLRLSVSVCQNYNGQALINDGVSLISMDDGLRFETVLNWNELTSKDGQEYQYICRLDEDIFLMVPEESGEMICLTRDSRPDTRKTVRIGFYGQAVGMMGLLSPRFDRYNPDYRVECISYGGDPFGDEAENESGLTKLLLDIGSGELDIVISEGWQLDPGAGFTDLYPFIDKDPELSRESFVPWMLKGLERDGELKQIWGSFEISSWVAFGPLASAPEPLELTACRDYLDEIGYDGLFLDNYITKDLLLSRLSANILESAYDEESDSYILTDPQIMELMELCNERPLMYEEPDYSIVAPSSTMSQVLRSAPIQLEYLQHLNESAADGMKFRIFDSSDGGESLTTVSCNYRSCYMIPEACRDKENAWGFLRTLLTDTWQEKNYAETLTGYPCNIAALETVLNYYASERAKEDFYNLLEGAVFFDHETKQLLEILVDSIQPYFYGDSDLKTALKYAQGRINIYCAEHKND